MLLLSAQQLDAEEDHRADIGPAGPDTFCDDCRRDWMSIPMPHRPSSDLAEQAIHKPAGRWIAEALGLDPDDGDISASLPIVYPLRRYLMTSGWRISAATSNGLVSTAT